MTQYSIRPNRSAIRAQAVYFLYSTMLTLTCLRLSDISVIYRVTYFSFQFSLLIFHILVARQHQHCGFNTQYRTLDVAENLGRYVSCTERTVQRKDFELILTVKMKTRHPVEGQFGSESPAICNHCGVMAA